MPEKYRPDSGLLEILKNLNWIFAKTMPQWPHEYIVRGPANEPIFVTLFDLIQEHGEVGYFKPTRRWYKYWYPGNGYKYWAVDNIPQVYGENSDLNQCVIINRAKVDDAEFPGDDGL